MVKVLKEIQPPMNRASSSTSGINYSVFDQSISELNCQGILPLESKPPGKNVKENERPPIAKMKRKTNLPELCEEAFKKPGSCLGMHIQQSVHVFPALRKKTNKKSGRSSSQAVGNSIKPKVIQHQSPPKTHRQSTVEEFANQTIPGRKPSVLGPVLSRPLTKTQRAEREALKVKAKQERERAAQNTSLGKIQFFKERDKEMEISNFYGYAI